jgi:hypothetical protein
MHVRTHTHFYYLKLDAFYNFHAFLFLKAFPFCGGNLNLILLLDKAQYPDCPYKVPDFYCKSLLCYFIILKPDVIFRGS